MGNMGRGEGGKGSVTLPALFKDDFNGFSSTSEICFMTSTYEEDEEAEFPGALLQGEHDRLQAGRVPAHIEQ